MRSPLRVACRRFAFPPHQRMCWWTCDNRPFKAAQFRHRHDPQRYAILHPSTRAAGWWQLSKFDERGPWGHVDGPTCEKALVPDWHMELMANDWKLESIVPGEPARKKETVMRKQRYECRKEIDREICELKRKAAMYERAENIHQVVRNVAEKRRSIEAYDYACVRIEAGITGGEDHLLRHEGSFKRFARDVARLQAKGRRDRFGRRVRGLLQSFSLTNYPEDTSCGYWQKRAGKKVVQPEQPWPFETIDGAKRRARL